MFKLKLKMDLSLSPCLQMIHSEPFSPPSFSFSELEQRQVQASPGAQV